MVGVLVQGLASNLGSIPTCGDNACTFSRGTDENLQFATDNMIAAHISHFHFPVQHTDMEALVGTVGWSTSPGTSVKFGINLYLR